MLKRKDLLGLKECSAEEICEILDTAEEMKKLLLSDKKQSDLLAGKALVTLFYENSTRTRSSFELAAKYLGASEVNIAVANSSVQKGETLIDTGETLDAMKIDYIVIRHPMAGAPALLAKHVKASVLNGGDGMHEHPTQALLDLYSIWEHKGRLEGLNVGIVGDISHSRVCGSLIPALKIMGANVCVVAPPTLLPADVATLGADSATSDLDNVLPDLDAVYMLRVQRERLEGAPFPSLREYNMLFGLTKERDRLMKPDALVCHPGPINRGVELDSFMADHPDRSIILDQVYAGILVRMAALYQLLGGTYDGIDA